MFARNLSVAFIFAAAAVLASGARAQSVEDFYAGKTIDLYIGYSVGGNIRSSRRASTMRRVCSATAASTCIEPA